MSEKLKLEPGKKYVRRDGKVVAVERDGWRLKSDGWHYDESGRILGLQDNDFRTIVAECKEDEPSGDVTLCDDATEEIVIEPGALVPPEHLAAARQMFRDGVEFFITLKTNGTDHGFIKAHDGDWCWDDCDFYVRRGPEDAWLKADAEPAAETQTLELQVGKTFLSREGHVVEITEHLADRQCYPFAGFDLSSGCVEAYTDRGYYRTSHRESEKDLVEEIASIAPGEEFRLDDADKVRTARLMQGQGVVFQTRIYTDDKWGTNWWEFTSESLIYRRRPALVTECQHKDATPDESQQPLKLEVGKSYRTRAGRRVDITRSYERAQDDGTGWQFYGRFDGDAEDDEEYLYCSDGRFFENGDDIDSDCDLVEEIGITAELDQQTDPAVEQHEDCDSITYTLSGTELRREMLRQIESCVCRDRQNTYGDAEDNFANIAALANVALQTKLAAPLLPEDVAIFSLCIKLARLIESPHHIDNWIDAGGYAVCGAGIMKRKELNAQHV